MGAFCNVGFDLEINFQGHLKVKVIFFNGNLFFWRRIKKEREILRLEG